MKGTEDAGEMRLLVTGGSHVVDALPAAGHAPRVLDLRPSPHHETSPLPIPQHLYTATKLAGEHARTA
jgi:nucleoside-diphosphate-sugar epimerase